jgi:hypothetical protein
MWVTLPCWRITFQRKSKGKERENLTSVDGSAVLQRRKWREREQEKEGGGSSKTKRVNGGGGSSAVVRGRVFNREESVRACWNFVWVKFV